MVGSIDEVIAMMNRLTFWKARPVYAVVTIAAV